MRRDPDYIKSLHHIKKEFTGKYSHKTSSRKNLFNKESIKKNIE